VREELSNEQASADEPVDGAEPFVGNAAEQPALNTRKTSETA
jgi:hypothetical protein